MNLPDNQFLKIQSNANAVQVLVSIIETNSINLELKTLLSFTMFKCDMKAICGSVQQRYGEFLARKNNDR
jgi:hypothetical protein